MQEDASTNRANDEEGPGPQSEEERERARAERMRETDEAIRAIIERHRETFDKRAE